MADGINVKFSATDAGFSGTVAKVNNSMRSMDDNARKVSNSVKSSFSGMAKAGAALAVGFGAIQAGIGAIRGTIDNFGAALDMGGELNDLSSRTGETAGNLMVLGRAFDNAGSSADKVGPTINKLQKAIIEAGQGNGAAVDAFKRLGLNLEELKYAAPIDQMRAVGVALQGVTNPSERAAIAMQVFGKSGGELLPMLMSMGEEIANAKGELGDFPGVMDRSAAAFDQLGDKISVMRGKLTEFAAGMLEGALPALNQFVEGGAKLDAAGFGAQIGTRLAEAFSLITSGEMWEIFKLKGEKAINSIQTSPAMNGFAATINTIWDGIMSKSGENFNFDETWNKYATAGIDANTEIADSLDERISGIMDRTAKRMADAARQLDRESQERAAESGIMVKDIRPPRESREIPELLKRVSESVKKDSKTIAENFATIAPAIAEAASLSSQVRNRTTDAIMNERVDPGGRLQAKANEAVASGDFSGARRAERSIAQREQNQAIQDAFGKGKAASRSLQDIAKEQGLETRGKGSRELRDELSKLAEADKKRQQEMVPGQGGKTKEEAAGQAKADANSILTEIKSLVDTIKTTVNKIEPKLPTHALAS